MGKASRDKGLKGEAEVAEILRSYGSCVKGLEYEGDWLTFYEGQAEFHVEVKRYERLRLPEWVRQAESEAPAGCVPVVAYRQSREPWRVVLQLAAFMEAIR